MPELKEAVSEATEKAPEQVEAGTEPIAQPAEVETSEATEKSATPEKKDDVELSDKAQEALDEEQDELDEFFGEPTEKKDNVQKRIDQLTAQIKELRSENEKLKGSSKPGDAPRYTNEQLEMAYKKAIEEGDSALALEALREMRKNDRRELVEMYEKEKSEAVNKHQAIYNEWNKVVNDYSRTWDDGTGREIYSGAKQELSLAANSLLYRVAHKLYTESRDENGSLVYGYYGGQRQAVADALAQILRRRKISGSDPEKKKMERQLAKAKKKASIPSSSSAEGETVRMKSSGDKLADYMAERKKFLSERQ